MLLLISCKYIVQVITITIWEKPFVLKISKKQDSDIVILEFECKCKTKSIYFDIYNKFRPSAYAAMESENLGQNKNR